MTETYRFIANEASDYPAVILCQLLRVSRSGYYAWKERPERQDQLAPKVEEVFWFHSRRYGSRRIAAELRRKAVIGRHRVRRLMLEQDLQAIQPRRFVPRTSASRHVQRRGFRPRPTDSRHCLPMSPTLRLERAIKVDRSRQVLAGHLTSLRRPAR